MLKHVSAVGGRSVRFPVGGEAVSPILHLTLFHPLNDHYGFAPIEAAQTSLDIHNAAGAWNKALLDNAARPSGAAAPGVPARRGRGSPAATPGTWPSSRCSRAAAAQASSWRTAGSSRGSRTRGRASPSSAAHTDAARAWGRVESAVSARLHTRSFFTPRAPDSSPAHTHQKKHGQPMCPASVWRVRRPGPVSCAGGQRWPSRCRAARAGR